MISFLSRVRLRPCQWKCHPSSPGYFWMNYSQPVSGTGLKKSAQLDFENTAEAYRSKTTQELLRHFVVFSTFTFAGIVNRSHKLVNVARNVLGHRLFSKLMKKTIYGQFVAGEDITAIRSVIERYRQNGVRAILDYSVEEDIPDTKEVVLETRTKATEGEHVDLAATTHDLEQFPQFKPTVTHADTTARASARTYFYDTEKKCDDVMKNFLNCVNMAADTTQPGDTAFAAIKLTGLGRVEFLLRLSKVVEGTRRLFLDLAEDGDVLTAQITPQSFYDGLIAKKICVSESEADHLYSKIDTDNKKVIGVLDWINRFQPGNELYRCFQMQKGFSSLALMESDDLKQMQTVVRRAHTIAECAEERNVRLMIDAEQTYFQPAIRHIAVCVLMPKYNREHPIIFNTIQCYLKNAKESLHMDVEYSKKSGFAYGVKLVRGAYLEQEREGASLKGVPDPVWSCKAETHKCYDECVEYIMTCINRLKINMMVATHNKESVKKAVELMEIHGVNRSDGSVVFGQLLGMCDHITFTLGNNGYGSYKYMPYGPVEDVIPYLIRRAFENKGMLQGADEERKLVRAELRRRLFPL